MATEHYAVYSLKIWRFLVSITIVRSIYSKDDTPLLFANVFIFRPHRMHRVDAVYCYRRRMSVFCV